ncbi:MAG: glycosyltransferase [Proteobacteria bacterium]|nr:glycosyltransferase [Pseudomonadota bacterium]
MATEKAAEQAQLVSIICRTVGRPELEKALQSVIAQTYSPIELVLVNAAARDLSTFESLFDSLNIVHVCEDHTLSRTQSANAGLDAASGSYLMFLDDDDWIGDGHVKGLMTFLTAQTRIRAAYSSVQKTNVRGKLLTDVFARDYDPITLMRDNYIPIHAMLFERSLLEKHCRFDESFDIYEDWDFWLQLSQHTDFYHLDKVTAFYRQGGDSDTAVEDVKLRYRRDNALGQARAAIFTKWKSQWSGESINQLFGDLDQSDHINDLANQLDGAHRRLGEEFKKNQELDQLLMQKQGQLEASQQQLTKAAAKLAESEATLAESQWKMQELANTQKHLRMHIRELESAIAMIYGSLSWRITRPLRGIKALFTSGARRATVTSSSREQEQVQEHSDDQTDSQQIKAEHDNRARALLKEFLASTDRLVFPASEEPVLSIVLIFYNQAHLSLLCLRSLLDKADVAFQLVIVDNSSTDETDRLIKKIENAKIISNRENLGFVRAVNQAAEQADSDYLLLLNNDALIERGTLSKAIATIAADETVGAVGAKIKLLDGSLQEAGSIIWSDGACLGYGRGQNPEQYSFMFQRDVDYCSGAFLLFRRSDFKELNGFDEAYAPAYYEESDFCIRLQNRGLRIVYNPEVQITHYEFASSGGIEGASRLQKDHQRILCRKHQDFLKGKLSHSQANILPARTCNNFPNVLLIDDRVPHPSLGSGYPRCAHILNSLSQLPLNVSFYPLQFPFDTWSAIYNTLDQKIEVILESGREGLLPFLQERKNFYQFMIVSRVHNMEFLNGLVEQEPDLLAGTRVIYDAEAVFAPREIMKAELLGETISETRKQQWIAKELEQARMADTVITVSSKEAELYRNAGYDQTRLLGHALRAEPGDKQFAERHGLLFVGALRDEGSPNVDSLVWFANEVLPLITEECPGIELLVVGDNSAPSLAEIAQNSIRFLGRLDSIRNTYGDCRIFIAPTRFAAGIPHKVHEAAAHGIPSVATALLADQLGWTDGSQLLVGDTAEEFAEQCVRLYQDAELWSQLRDAGLDAIIRDCSDDNFQATLRDLFKITAE